MFFAGCIFSNYFCFSVFFLFSRCYFFKVFLLRRIFLGCNAAVTSLDFLFFLRHCRRGIAASSGTAASCSGTAAMRHCRQYVCSGTAAMQRALTAAALPPACGSAASMHSLRHCRQQALTCSGIAAILSIACAAVPLNLNPCCNFGSFS